MKARTWRSSKRWLIPAIPVASFLFILLFGKRLPRRVRGRHPRPARELGAATGAAIHGSGSSPTTRRTCASGRARLHVVAERIVEIGAVSTSRSRRYDAVRRHVHLAARAHLLERLLKDDRRFTHFYAALSLVTASMLLLVVADNLLLLLVGWSWSPVRVHAHRHWWRRRQLRRRLKAFFTTRLARRLHDRLVILFFGAGQTSTSGDQPRGDRGSIGKTVLLVGAIALFLSRSARRPFPAAHLAARRHGRPTHSRPHHAATMVVAASTSSPFLRVFWEAFSIATTAPRPRDHRRDHGRIAALLAFVQDDIKKVSPTPRSAISAT